MAKKPGVTDPAPDADDKFEDTLPDEQPSDAEVSAEVAPAATLHLSAEEVPVVKRALEHMRFSSAHSAWDQDIARTVAARLL